MIVVAGEALVDLILGSDGSLDAALGGAPYNTARAAARLGAPVSFVGRLSTDRFGSRLTQGLLDDGVAVDETAATEAPTTLAAAEIGDDGAAQYRFYFAGTSAPDLEVAALETSIDSLNAEASSGNGSMFFTGGLGLVLEPMATLVLGCVKRLADDVLFVVDVNCRPAVVVDRDAYIDRVRATMRRADIVKVSDEDLAYLYPERSIEAAGRTMIDDGARVVVVTAGSSHTSVLDASARVDVAVPPLSGELVDTVGAGDTFGGGVLAWWSASGFGRGDVSIANVASAVAVGTAAAGIVVTRRGAHPPTLAELTDSGVAWPS